MRTKAWTMAVAVVVATSSGCAVVHPRPADPAQARMSSIRAGVAAQDRGDFATASNRYATVAAICPVDELGRQASLLLAAAELDPRNPGGRPQVSAELAAFQITHPGGPEWMQPLAEELYLTALDQGAEVRSADEPAGYEVYWTAYLTPDTATAARPPAKAAAADSTAAPVSAPAAAGGPTCHVPAASSRVTLPTLGRESMAARLGRLRSGEAAAAAGRVDATSEDVGALQAEVRRLKSELEQKDQELARIRRTLRP